MPHLFSCEVIYADPTIPQVPLPCALRPEQILCLEMYGLLPHCHYNLATSSHTAPAFPPHTVITMPALSPTMTAGNIGTWQKQPGDALAPGDVLVEIETDKAQMDFEFQEDGILAKILKDSGEKDIAVGNVS